MRTSHLLFFCITALFLNACAGDYSAEKILSTAEQSQLLTDLAPYYFKKPKMAETFDERFDTTFIEYYASMINLQNPSLIHAFKESDSLFFAIRIKDHKSLYEHYRVHGGYCKLDHNKKPVFVNMMYVTSQYTKEELEEKSLKMFQEMVSNKSMKAYAGNKEFLWLPNPDFEYKIDQKRWWYTDSSSWNFLREVKGED